MIIRGIFIPKNKPLKTPAFHSFIPTSIIILLVNCCHNADGGCGFPGMPANGTLNETLNFYPLGSSVSYSCDPGFILFGVTDRSCTDKGTWTQYVPYCDFNLAWKKRATQSTTFLQHGPWLSVDGDPQTCSFTTQTPGRRWLQVSLGEQHTVLAVAITISQGSRHDFSVFVVTAMLRGQSHVQECAKFQGVFGNETSTVYLECNAGEGLVGNYVRVRDDRNGVIFLTVCELEVFAHRDFRPCGIPELPVGGWSVNETSTKADYVCKDGLMLKGKTTVHCVDGEWDGAAPTCQDVSCNVPKPIQHGHVVVASESRLDGRLPVDAIAAYNCSKGFRLDGPWRRVCSQEGLWTGVEPLCRQIECGHPDLVANGTFRFGNRTSPVAVGSTAKLSCYEGFLPIGNVTVTICQPNGFWSVMTATCEPIALSDAYEESELGVNHGVTVGIVLVLVLVSAAIVLILYLKRRRHMFGSSDNKKLFKGPMPKSSIAGLSKEHIGPPIPQVNPGAELSDTEDPLYDDVVVPSANHADADSGRIYDQVAKDEKDEGHAYRSQVCNDRRELPPADGADAPQSPESHPADHQLQEFDMDPEPLYEPLRRNPPPVLRRDCDMSTMYARVDLHKKRRSRVLDGAEDHSNTNSRPSSEASSVEESCLSTPPTRHSVLPSVNDAFTGTVCIKLKGLGLGLGPFQRPLPPPPPSTQPQIMMDNDIYNRSSSKGSWEVAENELYTVVNEEPGTKPA